MCVCVCVCVCVSVCVDECVGECVRVCCVSYVKMVKPDSQCQGLG